MDRAKALWTMLAGYRSADESEEAHLASMRALLSKGGDPFDRDRYEPGHFTASAFVLSPDRSALLMILHGKLGLWLQPGGHIEPGDPDVLMAARREVAEEVGIEALLVEGEGGLFDLDVHPIPARKGAPEHRHFDLRFLFVAPSLEFAAGSEVKGARWVPFAEIKDAGTDGSVLRAVDKIRQIRTRSKENSA